MIIHARKSLRQTIDFRAGLPDFSLFVRLFSFGGLAPQATKSPRQGRAKGSTGSAENPKRKKWWQRFIIYRIL
jgi:hypothetical protein